MTVTDDTQSIAREFMQLWATSASNAIGQIVSGAFQIEVTEEAPAGPLEAAETDIYLTITVAGSARGEMSFRLPANVALKMARTFSGEPSAENKELTADHRSALDEFFRQIAGHVSTAAKEKWNELPITVASGEAPTWSPGASGWLCSAAGTPFAIAMEWRLSAALTTSLQAFRQASASTSQSIRPSPATNESSASNYDLLMNVDLELTLRFGEREMLLKDILELGAGAVIELDREVEDPADLLLDGRLIARGEVVIVDGNFGLRVTEVVPVSQTLA
jgi:flagellar motor switch protein FliN